MSPWRLPSRIPPHNLDAERAVLGAVLLEGRDALPRVIEVLRPSDFYTESPPRDLSDHPGALRPRRAGRSHHAQRGAAPRRTARASPGAPPRSRCWWSRPRSPRTWPSYSHIVRDMAVLRELIQTVHPDHHAGVRGQGGRPEPRRRRRAAHLRARRAAARGQRAAAWAASSRTRSSTSSVSTSARSTSPVSPPGFEKLDDETSGLQPSDFIIIAGRPSMGKTAFALNIAQHVGVSAARQGAGAEPRDVGASSSSSACCARRPRSTRRPCAPDTCSASDWARLTSAAGRLSEARIFIDDSPGLTVLEARAKARRMKAEHGLDLRRDRLPAAHARARGSTTASRRSPRSRARSRRWPRS